MATLSRVLPWRRHSASPTVDIEPLLSVYTHRHPDASVALIERAYTQADSAHQGQRRKSGEPYIEHPLAVAKIIAGLGLDDVTIASALLHDAVEDTSMSVADIEADFGGDVARIVDGVTKLDRLEFESKEAQQAATMRKMLVAIAKDLRVLITKLSDRLHNMRTVAALPAWKQQRISQETLDVYAPLAHRLGMADLKSQLEDLAFASLHPKWYAQIDHMVSTRSPERDLYLTQIVTDVQERLEELGIKGEVTGRPKHLWSIYEKMVVKGREFEDIYDLVGIRVTVDSVKDCYAAVGSIHATWKPVQGRFKDYIAMPKFNLYQSLHTTVVALGGKPLEVQIRTYEMHARAEYGVAAHWDYKEEGGNDDLAWLSRIIDWTEETSDPAEFMANLKTDLEQDEVFIFTPKGEVVTLPVGSTPVDFAYSIHTEVGHACVGARVNGRLVAIDTRLTSGDAVEIFTSNGEASGPSQDWLKFVATHKARNKIRQWYSRERRDDAIATGKDDVISALRGSVMPIHEVMRSNALDEIAAELNYTDRETLFAAVGEGHVSPKSVVSRVERALRDGSPDREEHVPATALRPRQAKRDGTGVGVHVEGLDDLWVRLAKCCTPVPPDEIIGFVTRGRGVSVHRSDCANAVSLVARQADRLIDVEWDDDGAKTFVATIEVKALDRARLLVDVAQAMSDQEVNILAASTKTATDRTCTMHFDFELGDASQIDSLLGMLRGVDSVYSAYRVLPGSG
jgi:guanosine-3',5'-bis(diphosphate) 3'-pyrophosphohydrolase